MRAQLPQLPSFWFWGNALAWVVMAFDATLSLWVTTAPEPSACPQSIWELISKGTALAGAGKGGLQPHCRPWWVGA